MADEGQTRKAFAFFIWVVWGTKKEKTPV